MSPSATVLAAAVTCVIVAGLVFGCAEEGTRPSTARTPEATVADHMAQWKARNPDRANQWVEEEKQRHKIQPSADNADVLKGEQAKGQAYGNYTQRDVLMWARETEKLVVEGSRIFHNADRLGGTVGVSCDMCHPDAANTHPETYPKFQPQMGRVALLRDMINWCIQHPVRGQALAPDSPEMRALEAYIVAQRKGEKLDYGRH